MFFRQSEIFRFCGKNAEYGNYSSNYSRIETYRHKKTIEFNSNNRFSLELPDDLIMAVVKAKDNEAGSKLN